MRTLTLASQNTGSLRASGDLATVQVLLTPAENPSDRAPAPWARSDQVLGW